MTRAITEEEFVGSGPELLESVGKQTLLIQKDGKPFAALISMSEYESTREARAEKAIAAMEAFQRHMQQLGTPEELENLEKALDRKLNRMGSETAEG